MNSHPVIDQLCRKQLPAHYSEIPQVHGQLTRVIGLTLEAKGLNVALGDACLVDGADGGKVQAEVVGFSEQATYLMPYEKCERFQIGACVQPARTVHQVPAGKELLGRVVDGLSRPLDGGGDLYCSDSINLHGDTINPLQRQPIRQPLDVGIRAINGLLTVGRGQRLGLFAGSGVGKSVLLGMMTRHTEADVVVVSLVGERGREVREFIEQNLGEEGLRKTIVVASPADDVPLMRLRASMLATRYAEYFREQGANVLLLMDSLTRFAQAQREVGLATGELPASRGYPPSVFAKLPQLVERAGNAVNGQGSMTAFYTVLAEGDDLQDPIVDAARAILDGHIVLSRHIAEQGIYPAIDVEASISRVMPAVVQPQHGQTALQFKQLYSLYNRNEDLINIGAYSPGSNPDIDRAIVKHPQQVAFLKQSTHEKVGVMEAANQLASLLMEQANPVPVTDHLPSHQQPG